MSALVYRTFVEYLVKIVSCITAIGELEVLSRNCSSDVKKIRVHVSFTKVRKQVHAYRSNQRLGTGEDLSVGRLG